MTHRKRKIYYLSILISLSLFLAILFFDKIKSFAEDNNRISNIAQIVYQDQSGNSYSNSSNEVVTNLLVSPSPQSTTTVTPSPLSPGKGKKKGHNKSPSPTASVITNNSGEIHGQSLGGTVSGVSQPTDSPTSEIKNGSQVLAAANQSVSPSANVTQSSVPSPIKNFRDRFLNFFNRYWKYLIPGVTLLLATIIVVLMIRSIKKNR